MRVFLFNSLSASLVLILKTLAQILAHTLSSTISSPTYSTLSDSELTLGGQGTDRREDDGAKKVRKKRRRIRKEEEVWRIMENIVKKNG
jgi:hypothetical protein